MAITIDLTAFNREFDGVTFEFLNVIADSMQSQLTEEVRVYPRETKRKYGRGRTGKLAGSRRDVVDSGELVNSFDLSINKSISSITGNYTYSADHAIFVYLGYVLKTGAKVPPYPWIANAIRELDILKLFEELWNGN